MFKKKNYNRAMDVCGFARFLLKMVLLHVCFERNSSYKRIAYNQKIHINILFSIHHVIRRNCTMISIRYCDLRYNFY